MDEKKQHLDTIVRSVVVAQNKGALTIKDAALLFNIISNLNTESPEYSEKDSIDAMVQAIVLGQSKGAYTLQEASIISKAIAFFQVEEPAPKEDKKIKEL